MYVHKIYFKCVAWILIFFVCISLMLAFVKVMANNNSYDFIGKVIYVDAGHGGKDNGAGVDGVLEDEVNMKISKLLFENLIDLGAYVLMSRISDYDLANVYDKKRKKIDLMNRIRYINQNHPDVFVSIHLNTYSSEQIYGPQVFYQNHQTSIKLANIIQNKLNILATSNRISKFGDFYILNNTRSIGVLIECGFLSNNEERKKLND